MDTIVELHDTSFLKNFYAITQLKPKNAIFLCGENPQCNQTKEYLRKKMPETHIFYHPVGKGTEGIYQTLLDIKKEYGQIAIDITGGSDLELVTIGRFAQENQVPLFQTDIQNENFVCISNCNGVDAFHKEKTLYSIEDFIQMAGGKVAGNGHIQLKSVKAEYEKAVFCLWEEFIKNPSRWNRFVAFIKNKGVNKRPGLGELEEEYTFEKKDIEYVNMLERFFEINCGVVKNLVIKGNQVQYEFSGDLMKDCLKMEGSCLEIYVFMMAQKMNYFDDVRVSTIVDWDGKDNGKWEVRNEIDVMLLKGTVPIFVSCKVGKVDPKSLAELDMLVRRFGGDFAKGVMVTADNPNPSIRNRSRELNIDIIRGTELRAGELENRLIEIYQK